MRYFLILLIIFFPGYWGICSSVVNPDLSFFSLDNGLRVALSPRKNSQLIAIKLYVHAGSMTEGKYLGTGISHVLEHMCFKGTEGRVTTQLAKDVRKKGGTINAHTSFLETVYEVTFPSDKIDDALEIVSDLVLSPKFSKEELKKELAVVERELDMREDRPSGLLSKKFWSTLYKECPAKYPVIGYREKIKEITLADIQDYYNTHYYPKNMLLVVTGSLDIQKTKKLCQKYYSKFKVENPSPKGNSKNFTEPEPKERTTFEFEKVGEKLYRTQIGWPTVDLHHQDVAPLDLLATLLGGTRSSLIQEKLVLEKIVLSGSSFSYTPTYPGCFGISLTFTPQALPYFEQKLDDLIEYVKNNEFTQEEIHRALQNISLDSFSQIESVEGEAAQIGSDILFGLDKKFTQKWLDNLKQVTPKDIQRVANKYLKKDRQTIVLMKPENSEPYFTKPETKKPLWIKENKNNKNQAFKSYQVGSTTLLLFKRSFPPLCHVRWVQHGGVIHEKKGQEGLFKMYASMLATNSEKYDLSQWRKQLDSWGSTFSTYSGRNSYGFQGSVVSQNLTPYLRATFNQIEKSQFTKKDLERNQNQFIASYQEQLKTPSNQASLELKKMILGSEHPYARVDLGTLENIKKWQIKDLESFHQENYSKAGSVLSIAGSFNEKEVLEWAQETFGDEDNFISSKERNVDPLYSSSRLKTLHLPITQATFMMGFKTVPMGHADETALNLLAYYLSGQASPLFKRIREDKGLAYSAHAGSSCNVLAGHFYFYVGTETQNILEVEKIILDLIKDLNNSPLSKQEFKDLQSGFLGRHIRSIESLRNISMSCALQELYGLGADNPYHLEQKIKQLTPEKLQEIVQTYLTQDKNYQVHVLPLKNE